MSETNITNINNGNNILLEEKLVAIEEAANIITLENQELEKYILELKKEVIKEKDNINNYKEEVIKEKQKYNELTGVVNNYKEQINIANSNRNVEKINMKKELKKLSQKVNVLENRNYDSNLFIKKLLAEKKEADNIVILNLKKELIKEKHNVNKYKEEVIKEKQKYNELTGVVNNYKEQINIANTNTNEEKIKIKNMKRELIKLSQTVNVLENCDYHTELLTNKQLVANKEKENIILEEKLTAIEEAANIVILEKEEQEKYVMQLRKELVDEKRNHKTTATIAAKAAAAAKKAASAAATAAAAAAMK